MAGQVEAVAEHPQAASAIVEFEGCCVCDGGRVYYPTRDGDLLVTKLAWIAIDGFNAHMM